MTTSARARRRPDVRIVAAYLRELRMKAAASALTTPARRPSGPSRGGIAGAFERRAQTPRA
jgi:hypothetical protein